MEKKAIAKYKNWMSRKTYKLTFPIIFVGQFFGIVKKIMITLEEKVDYWKACRK